MDGHMMSGYSEYEPVDQDETGKEEKKTLGTAMRQEEKEVLDEDLKCFYYWLSDANTR